MGCWQTTSGKSLNQGDLLRGISIPLVRASFPNGEEGGPVPLDVELADVVVLTQSCDLEQRKTATVLVATAYCRADFEAANENYKAKGKWKEVARGRVEGLHLLRSPEAPNDLENFLVLDFRKLASLPIGYVSNFAGGHGERWRLLSPYLEHLSQAFGRYFMRVALPDEFDL